MNDLFGEGCCSRSKPKLGLHLPVCTVIFSSSGSYYPIAEHCCFIFFHLFFSLSARQPDSPGDEESDVCALRLGFCRSLFFFPFFVRSHYQRASHAEVLAHEKEKKNKRQKTKQRICGTAAQCGNRIVTMMVIIKGLWCWQRRPRLCFGSHHRKSIATVKPACFRETGIHFCPL